MTQAAFYAATGTAVRGALVFCGSILAATAIAYIGAGNRVLSALIATIMLAALGQLILQPLPQFSVRSQWQDWRQLPFDFAVTCAALAILAYAVPIAKTFVCEATVPWNIWIAVFGAFAFGFLGTGTTQLGANAHRGLLTLLALFWIGPFYGFFYGPWFLAQVVALPCASRSLFQSVALAVSMIPASVAGQALAQWLYDRRS